MELLYLFSVLLSSVNSFLPGLSAGYCSSKLTLHFEDGAKFMERHKEEFDVIITDSSDPIGMNVKVFVRLALFLMIICMGTRLFQLIHLKYCQFRFT